MKKIINTKIKIIVFNISSNTAKKSISIIFLSNKLTYFLNNKFFY